MSEVAKQAGRIEVERLVETFSENLAHYKSSDFTEAATRLQFIDPFLGALGWDVADRAGLGPRREVIVEYPAANSANVEGEDDWDDDLSEEELAARTSSTTFPDYVMQFDGSPALVVEAKKPAINLRWKAPTFQAKSYAWTLRLPVAALTDFEELRIFDARHRPRYDEPTAGILGGFDLRYTDYISRWDDIWALLSRDAVLAGSLGEAVRDRPAAVTQVDTAFLAELTSWRQILAQTLLNDNPGLSRWDLAEATQRILDRVVLIRVMEDRGILPSAVLRRYARLNDSFRRLQPEMRALDGIYNGQLFAEHFSERLDLSDSIFQRLVESLYFPKSPYRFDLIGTELLGTIYERFLGEEIEIAADGTVSLEQKPEVRHAGGVYYTPRWVVNEIVDATLGTALARVDTPSKVANLKIVDPACGSGAFLLGAFDRLVKWHVEYYNENPDADREAHFVASTGERRLTSDAKSRIISNNIFGVDIDLQAVEVTQMSLYLAVLEDENESTLGAQQRLFEQAYLPALDKNIRWGNSLLEPGDVPQQLLLGDEALSRRINPFSWSDEHDGFGTIMSNRGGFDVVLGNPPYTRAQVLRRYRPEETQAYQSRYQSASEGSFDIAMPFVERGLDLLRQDGRLGYIVSRQFTEVDAGKPLRGLLSSGRHVRRIVDFQDGLVFGPSVGAYTCILILGPTRANSFELTRVLRPPSQASLRSAETPGSAFHASVPARELTPAQWRLDLPAEQALLDRLLDSTSPLQDLCDDTIFQGPPTGADYIFKLRDLGPDPDNAGCRRVRRRDNGIEGVIEETLLRPVVAGKGDIDRFYTKRPTEVLLLPYSRSTAQERYRLLTSAELAQSPNAQEWVSRHEVELMRRAGNWTAENYWHYSRRQNLELFAEPKIMVPYMVKHLCAVLDSSGAYFVNVSTGGYGISTMNLDNPEFVAAILESRIASWVMSRFGRPFRGGWFGVRKKDLGQIPIPTGSSAAEQAAVVDAHRACTDTRSAAEAATSDSTRQLAERRHREAVALFDETVDGLFGLTESEAQILDQS